VDNEGLDRQLEQEYEIMDEAMFSVERESGR